MKPVPIRRLPPLIRPALLAIALALVMAAPADAATVARYTYSPAEPVVDQPITFDGSSSTCRPSCVYTWAEDGPDGPGGLQTPLGTGEVLTYTFHEAGTKYVRLAVQNKRGRTSSTVKTITVQVEPPPPPPPPGDTTPPSVNLTAPSNGANVSGTTMLSADATDNVAVDHVSFRVDGNTVNTDSTAPYSFSWDSTGVADGSHSVTALAVDTAGNNTASPAAGVTVNNTPPPPPPPGGLTLQPIDGGTSYYRQFANPLPDDPGFFPVAAWFRPIQDQGQADLEKDFGMNTFVGVECPECTQESLLRSNGLHAIIQASERTRFDDIGTETAGWLLGDEVDMCCGPPGFAGGNGYNMLDSTLGSLPADHRLRYANYGKGVLDWESDADAAKFINGHNGPNSYQQVVSTDQYWFTDPNAQGDPRYGFGSSYGDDVAKVRRLDALDGVRQPVWEFVELGWPFTEGASAGGRRILPDELRSAVWHGLIAGARGIIYFDHNFGPGTPGSTILGQGYADNQAMAKAVDGQISGLAPVLNSPFVTSGTSATDTMAGNVRYVVKWSGGHFYVFAGADHGAGDATFSIPCVGGATATRLAPSNLSAEAASIPVSGGSFTDSFADKNSIHIYRIDGGSNCGLTAG